MMGPGKSTPGLNYGLVLGMHVKFTGSNPRTDRVCHYTSTQVGPNVIVPPQNPPLVGALIPSLHQHFSGDYF